MMKLNIHSLVLVQLALSGRQNLNKLCYNEKLVYDETRNSTSPIKHS